MLLSLVAFILLLGVLIFVHELGHFLVAKLMGMRIDEFAIGFPPRIKKWQIGETAYCIGALPLGGYVKIHGENPEEPDQDSRSFQQRPIWARLLVIIAGVGMNFLLAFILLCGAYTHGFTAIPDLGIESLPGAVILKSQVQVIQVLPGTAADTAGVKAGDLIDHLTDPQDKQAVVITSTKQLQEYTVSARAHGHLHQQISVIREGTVQDLDVQLDSGNKVPLGVVIDVQDQVKVPFWRAPQAAWRSIGAIAQVTWDALRQFGEGLILHAQLDKNVSGPVGIYKATSVATHEGFSQVLFLAVVLSINLALLNILPIPALDGGKLLFLVIEAVFRRRVISERIEAIVTNIGMGVLLLLILLITIQDIVRSL